MLMFKCVSPEKLVHWIVSLDALLPVTGCGRSKGSSPLLVAAFVAEIYLISLADTVLRMQNAV